MKTVTQTIIIPVVVAISMLFVGCSDTSSNKKLNTKEIQDLASKVKKDDIIFYGTSSCPYCTAAKGWLSENNFTYTDCDLEDDKKCYDEYTKIDGNGIPFLVINHNGEQHQMRDGFDSDQMLNILASD